MKLRLLAVGQKMPAWVSAGFEEYANRMPPEARIELVEIPLAQRGKSRPVERVIEEEGERLLSACGARDLVVALDVRGKGWSTEDLAERLDSWQQEGRDISLLVGGPDGLSQACLDKAEQRWSLSSLTLPHPLVRIVLAEQLYRAVSILKNHPYHRA